MIQSTFLVLLVVLTLGSCTPGQKTSLQAKPSSQRSTFKNLPDGVKPVEFSFGILSFTNKSKSKLSVELAETREQQARGLMYRKKLEDGAGMLFIYPKEQQQSFWMKNTFVPLSIGFFDKNQELIEIRDMEPVTSVMQVDIPSYQSRKKARYALEVPRGWFQRAKVKLGDRFTLKRK